MGSFSVAAAAVTNNNGDRRGVGRAAAVFYTFLYNLKIPPYGNCEKLWRLFIDNLRLSKD